MPTLCHDQDPLCVGRVLGPHRLEATPLGRVDVKAELRQGARKPPIQGSGGRALVFLGSTMVLVARVLNPTGLAGWELGERSAFPDAAFQGLAVVDETLQVGVQWDSRCGSKAENKAP